MMTLESWLERRSIAEELLASSLSRRDFWKKAQEEAEQEIEMEMRR